MKTSLPTYWKIYGALLAIFVSGSTLGYVTGHRMVPQGLPLAPPLVEDDATAEWAEKALNGLEGTLGLTEEQVTTLRPVLERTGKNVFRQRDRALFQISLEVLAVHDELLPYLDPEQQKKLVKSKENMHLTIESRFKSLIDLPVSLPEEP